jgi:hypothetical protein
MMGSATPHKIIANPSLDLVVKKMIEFARGKGGSQSLEIRNLVEQLCKNLPSGDYSSEILACYYWVHQNTRYMRDGLDIETLKWPVVALTNTQLDCDDMSMLIAAMLMACGNEPSFVLTGFRPEPNGMKWDYHHASHVFCAAKVNGLLVPLDPVANAETSTMMRRAAGFRTYRVVDGGGLSGLGAMNGATPNFSVYDYVNRKYKYYVAPSSVPLNGWFRGPSSLGAIQGSPFLCLSPEGIAAKLPPNARLTGTGLVPMGLIATDKPGEGIVQSSKRNDSGARATGIGEAPLLQREVMWNNTRRNGGIF